MSEGLSWHRFCVVGIGNHARTKLIPALLENGQQVAGLVSRKASEAPPGARVFSHIDAALEALPADTVFLIASPPALHLGHALRALAARRDVVIEKPAFLTARDVRSAARACGTTGTVLVEAFMHRHTGLYRRLLDFWDAESGRIAALDAEFIIPEAPRATFRSEAAIASSALYDIGCYIVSLLADLRLSLDDLRIVEVAAAGDPAGEAIVMAGASAMVGLSVRVGIGPEYRNQVTLRTLDGQAIRFRPFFYGRLGEKVIEWHRPLGVEEERFCDPNAFRTMFSVPRERWLEDQPARLAQMELVAEALERLGGQLADARAAVG